MIYISRYTNYRLSLRPTIKEHVNTATGGQEVITHRGVIVEFQKCVFDTKNWETYSRPSSPDRINVIRSEADLIRLMEASPYFGQDFHSRIVETPEQRKAKLREELARIEAEEAAEAPELAPEFAGDVPSDADARPTKKVTSKTKKKSSSKNSRVEL